MPHAMQHTMPVDILETTEPHRHPGLDISALEDEHLVANNRFEVGIEKLEDEVDVLLDREDVKELWVSARNNKPLMRRDEQSRDRKSDELLPHLAHSCSPARLLGDDVGPLTPMMLGWCNSWRNFTSRSAVISSPSFISPTLIFLIATVVSLSLLLFHLPSSLCDSLFLPVAFSVPVHQRCTSRSACEFTHPCRRWQRYPLRS